MWQPAHTDFGSIQEKVCCFKGEQLFKNAFVASGERLPAGSQWLE
jgi:hypothetical protein